ncbi:MAG: riboflavin kinase [Patescibacteria group bacterium]|nr:riboflavin kinase [Patescibacteria group bacterium]
MQYVISGKVIPGDKYGRKLGFPTINLDVKAKEPSPGIYAGKAIIKNKVYRAAIVINEAGRAEAHLFGYREDAYGKVATLRIKKFIRKFEKFATESELISQIEKDLKKC